MPDDDHYTFLARFRNSHTYRLWLKIAMVTGNFITVLVPVFFFLCVSSQSLESVLMCVYNTEGWELGDAFSL